MEIDFVSAVGHLFSHNHTYSDLDIARRITEDYNIQHMTLTARLVKRIRLEQGWLRRHNDPAAVETQEAGTIDAIERLLAEGHIRQYGPRQFITHPARKHGQCYGEVASCHSCYLRDSRPFTSYTTIKQDQLPHSKDRSKGEDVGSAMQTEKDQQVRIKDCCAQ
jgi:hypothetical protein